MPQSRTLYVGCDVHKESMAVASVAQEHGAEVTYLGTIGTRQCDIDTRIRKMHSQATPLFFVYEAGPCGDWLYRDLTRKGSPCWVVAPSLRPNKAGHRGATHRFPRICARGHRTHGAPSASGASTPRPGERVALLPSGRGPAGPASGAMHCGRHHGGCTRRPQPVCEPQRAHEVLGTDPVGIFAWGATPTGLHDQSGEHPGPPGAD